MLKNYLVTALRSLRRQKGYAAINTVGLAVGLACAALILGYVRLEESFDRFHPNAERTVRVVQHQPDNMFMGSDRFAVTPEPLGRALRDEAPEVEAAATFRNNPNTLLIAGEQRLVGDGFWADGAFLDVFSFPLVRGVRETALANPDGLVLTETLSQTLFGDADPLGATVEISFIDSLYTYTVTGIMADIPVNSHLRFDYLRALSSSPDHAANRDEWGSSGTYTYAVLRPDVSLSAFDERLAALFAKYQEVREGRTPARPYAEPMTAIHLRSNTIFDPALKGDARLVALFSAIALVILLLACVNYTNLAVARSAQRAREVGMRKVSGASRVQIASQHLTESVLTALGALGLGLLLARVALPLFESWMERDLGAVVFSTPTLLLLVGVAVLVGLVAGAYPALVLTSLQPTQILKGQAILPTSGLRLRSVLVVGQYASALVLVIGSLVIYQQLDFVQNRSLGFDREHIVTLQTRGVSADGDLAAFKQVLADLPGVTGVTASSYLPTTIASSSRVDAWTGHPEGSGSSIDLYMTQADTDFFEVYDMEIVAGRAFSPVFPTDTLGAVVLNETATRALGWTPETALGNRIEQDGGLTVVGVVQDFHMHSMHQPIAPLMIRSAESWINHLSLRVRPGDLTETLEAAGRSWATYSAYPFEYEFLDETFDRLYADERRLGEGVLTFTVVALLIACLGLFGLAAYTAQRRTKEVGIRKVLGASVASLVGLLSKDFLKLVLVSLAVAAPVAYVGMSRWLEAFAYRIDLGPGVFLLAAGLALTVALITVGVQAVRAASADPVRALRHD